MIFMTLFTALALSAVAAYYSVIGLTAIFPGSFWPIIIMGSVFEVAKLVTISWTYRNWETAPKSLRTPFVVAVVILMLITSMGIFGYLSKAHLEHSADMEPLVSKVQIMNDKIATLKENINENRKTLKLLDEQVNEIMGRSNDEKGVSNSVATRRSQSKERDRITNENDAYQKKISELIEEKAPLQNELSKAESDFGPIKYVAELVYGSGDRTIIDKAVRLVIMLIMVVFDPLAVLLLIAANMSIRDDIRREIEHSTKPEEVVITKVVEQPKEEKVDNTIEVPTANIANIESPVVATTTYDYTVPFAFEKAKDIASGKF